MGCGSSSSVEEIDGRKKKEERKKENSFKNEGNSNLNEISNEIQNNNNNSIEKKDNIKETFLKKSLIEEEDNKIIVPPPVKEYIIEGNDVKEDKSYKKRTYEGLTILENIKEFIPEKTDRDYIKNMVYNCLSANIVKNESEYIKGKNFTHEQVEGIIDTLFKIVNENENVEINDIKDERLNDVNVKIGFYDANEENIKKFIFKGKNPTDEEVENMLDNFNSGNGGTKILEIEWQNN